MRKWQLTLALALPLVIGCGGADRRSAIDISNPTEAWNAINDPRQLGAQYEATLAALPGSGASEIQPWSDSYWPSYQGGLAARWADPERPDAFKYPLNPLAALRSMTKEQLAALSPAEKYDIYTGNYQYPFVKYERSRTSPDDEGWFGLCHGWAPAALVFKEPSPVTLKSRDGIEVPFGSSDVKALLTFMQQYDRAYWESRMMGDRCNHDISADPGSADDPECRDVNAGSFHIIMTNYLGRERVGFVAEVNRGLQVWNQPVYAFETEITGETDQIHPGAAPGTVRVASVRTKIHYVSELSANWEPMPLATFPWQAQTADYEYRLELDGGGRIIGGEWDGHQRPDFIWTQVAARFEGYFQPLRAIYQAAVQ